ncbi:MAG TPA: C40 family peptidase [Ohtaekwangia sp.]|nr:C40 family peptidase [Ohtaekwangia sp.]
MMNTRYGVCRLSVVPVRGENSDRAEQVTQLLFGDHYEILEVSPDQKWLRIKIYADQYEGWINHLQHHEVTPEYYEHINRTEFKITTDLTSTMLYNKIPLAILMGSMIPISSSELFKMEEQFAFNGEAKNAGQKREAEFLKTTAAKYLHAPYQWGGKSPFGVDCSGFTQMVFRISGYSLNRDAWQQARQGKFIATFAEMKPADLVFFQNDAGKIVHVGIFLGGDRIIHASGRVRVDQLSDAGICNSESKITTHRYSHIRRILPDQAG